MARCPEGRIRKVASQTQVVVWDESAIVSVVSRDNILSPSVSVVAPVYNEEENLEPLLERVTETMETLDLPWELVIVDDGSTDGSGQLLDEMASAVPLLKILHFTVNHGQSAALDAAFRHAAGELVVIIDADLQTYPEDIPKLIQTINESGADAVVGIRVNRKDTIWKRFSARVANSIRNRLTREDIEDTGCPLKVVRRHALAEIARFDGMHRFMPSLLRLEGFEVIQIPVRHTKRAAGRSKYGTWDRAFRGLRDALGMRWLQDRHFKWKIR